VKLLRIFLPLAAVASFGLYLSPSQWRFEVAGGEAVVEAVDISAGNLRMVNPRLKGKHAKQGEYDVRADSAVQSLTNTDVISLDKVDGDVISPTGDKTVLTAPSGVYNSKTEEMHFPAGVTIVRSTGLTARLKSATVFFSKNLVVSNEPVEVRLHESHIRADSVELFTDEARAVFKGRVFVHLERQPQAEAAAKPPESNAKQ
jgi:lipopolysaccharide export system protein LptC